MAVGSGVKAVLFDLGGTLWASFGDRTEDEVTAEAATRVARAALAQDDAESDAGGRAAQVRRLSDILVSRFTALKPARRLASRFSFADPVFREEDMVRIVQDAAERASQGAVCLDHRRLVSLAEQFGHDLSRHYRLYAETLSVLAELRARQPGLILGIVSNTTIQPRIIDFYLAECGLDKMVDFRILSSEVGWRKPHPAIYAAALARAGVRPRETLFVGDRPIEDVAGPSRLGLRTVLCRFDGEREALSGGCRPGAVIPDLLGLLGGGAKCDFMATTCDK